MDKKAKKCDLCNDASTRKKFYTDKTFIVTGILALLYIISFIIPFLVPYREQLMLYIGKIWWAVLLGFLLGGLIDHFIPREYISKLLAKKDKSVIFKAVLLGFLMSACSHGILALSIQLHKKGASTPSVVAFLLSSPWANMAVTIMLIGFFGIKAVFMILGALLIALITGFVFQLLEKRGLIESNRNSIDIDQSFSIKADIKKRWANYKLSAGTLKRDINGVWSGAVSLGNMVLWWILIGIGIASIAGAYIPTDIFKSYMGPTVLGLIVTLILATLIEVCSEGSAPMAFEIFKQTGAFGNSFVFLMAGVATDYTEIGLLWSNVGKRTAIWLPIITVPQVILLGLAANYLF